MAEVRGRSGAQSLFLLGAAFIALGIAGCGPEEDLGKIELEGPATGSFAACLPWYENDVESVAVSGNGDTWLYLTDRRPTSLPDDASWRSDDLALFVRDRTTNESRYIATSWDSDDEISAYATADLNDQQSIKSEALPETMREVAISDDGKSFIVSVDQAGVDSGRAKLYAGAIPVADASGTSLKPGEGLTEVPINNHVATEGIGDFSYSPDGEKVAAVVGSGSEFRVFDLSTDTIFAYDLGDENEIVVKNEMPEAATSIKVSRQPAIRVSTGGLIWSNDSSKIAFARPEGVGTMSLYILDYASGDLEFVRSFDNSTIPQIAWSIDNQSLFLMSTNLSTYQPYGDTEFRRVEATANGSDIGSGVAIQRSQAEFLNWTTEPANLVNVDDDTLLFTWEGRLYRLKTAGGDMAGAEFVPLTVYHLIEGLVDDNVAVDYERPFASAERDSVVFMVQDGSRTKIGERTEATAESCSEIVPLEETDSEEAAPEDG